MTPEEKLQHLFAAAAAPARDPVFEAETALRVARRRAVASAAASIPLAMDVAIKDGRIKRGDMVLLEAMGGGLTWGACAFRL